MGEGFGEYGTELLPRLDRQSRKGRVRDLSPELEGRLVPQPASTFHFADDVALVLQLYLDRSQSIGQRAQPLAGRTHGAVAVPAQILRLPEGSQVRGRDTGSLQQVDGPGRLSDRWGTSALEEWVDARWP